MTTEADLRARIAELEFRLKVALDLIRLVASIDVDSPTEHDDALLQHVITEARSTRDRYAEDEHDQPA